MGVAYDAAGNVYVADHGNDRIQVFSAEGKFLESIETKAPELLGVSRKTAAVYATNGGPSSGTGATRGTRSWAATRHPAWSSSTA